MRRRRACLLAHHDVEHKAHGEDDDECGQPQANGQVALAILGFQVVAGALFLLVATGRRILAVGEVGCSGPQEYRRGKTSLQSWVKCARNAEIISALARPTPAQHIEVDKGMDHRPHLPMIDENAGLTQSGGVLRPPHRGAGRIPR